MFIPVKCSRQIKHREEQIDEIGSLANFLHILQIT